MSANPKLEVAPGVYVHGTREAISILQARLAPADPPVPQLSRSTRMDITSIDNCHCYQEEGLVLAHAFLGRLNQQKPHDPLRRVLVAVLPEFREDGRLDRLNFLTVTAADPATRLSAAEIALMDAAAKIVADLQAARAKAYAAVTEPTVEPYEG